MEAADPSPQTTLLILLGASEWPQFPEFQGSKAFANAVQRMKAYFINPQQFGLPAENLLDLFDSEKNADELDVEISQFLERRLIDMKKAGNPARDVLLYFVGHGGFVGCDSDFYLAIRRTRIGNPRSSGLHVTALAYTLKERARFLRRIVILDCCFAAAAFSAFEGGPDGVAIEKAKAAFQVGYKTVGKPTKGTTLLCSSSQKSPSRLLPDGSSTMFTKTFLDALAQGTKSPHYLLTLRDVKNVTADLLMDIPDAPKPVVLSPDQSEGDVADLPFFPNPCAHMPTSSFEFSIQPGDITSFKADALALKYAQGFYGTDKIVASLLSNKGIDVNTLQPIIGDYRYIETRNCIQADHALFIGVPQLFYFNYQDIQKFAAQVLQTLAGIAPITRHVAMTIHGANCGLDEIEAFLAQFKGYLDALQSGQFPLNLEKITIIDKNLQRVERLREAFEENFSYANFISQTNDRWTYRLDKQQLNINFRSDQWSSKVSEKAGIASKVKPYVFVAMPFKKDMDDVFYYGIQQPARAAGFICERVDHEAFTGDILDQVKRKIENAAVVIAELTGANPNVYLEVGYAWGKGRPTLLLAKNEQELCFDVQGQRCLQYERIKDLEDSLNKELNDLKSKGLI